MYAPYFGLSQEPFSIAPDPRYLYMSERHREALAHLLYGVGGGGGFVLLTGEIGTGKTTVCRCFLEQIPPATDVAYIFNPKLTALELLQSVCEEFHIAVPRQEGATAKDWLDPLNAYLLQAHAAGRNSVLVIDEAQNLSADVLEQLRLLTNLETNERKLLQIILIGQPELRGLLARPELEQLAQRVIARYHLDALTREETVRYVRHRLEVAGLSRALPFERRALALVHRLTGGVPRRINLLCDRALLGAYARSEAAVTPAIVRQAAREVFGAPEHARPGAWPRPAFVLGLGIAAGAALVVLARLLGEGPAPAAGVATPRPARPASAAVAAVPAAPAASAATSAASAPASVAAAPAAGAGVIPTAAAPAAPASAAPPTLLRDERAAWRELAKAWNAEAGDGDPCKLLPRQGLHCYTRSTPLPLIRQLDRPGIVTLDRESGTPSYALLTALTDKTATLSAGGTAQTVTLAALASRWNGEWATLWKAPVGYDPREADTTLPAAQRWAAAQLPVDTAGGKAAAPLRQRIRSFQLEQGLPVDGTLGPLTFMQLNRQARVDEPRLAP
ncbi:MULTISPECIES: ExeA family protein [Ramlibacter]|uniref:AAA family ATPase n=1 Tax=Ramlibacter pinisoli TaxID=2682844 RepID=A0A6N8IQ71_9BURK|nr:MULTISPECIES: ExeA family protein [Ramlibacter]MBA2963329.1 AAA family ATPase [Ramlibacter sp. CGMCC 1.13660]MVQ28296.1 AAA family ATPase [Ramlibacter pinisoli]